ncbi:MULTISPECIES: peptidylprolyl isomerase [unclassified Enterococcus]|uniref:peptidylprolyl isomerase n=1 Tax=unclassified Enterococcus TaxID=2608891 RepID=UPI0024737D5D|nr:MULTISPECIES: peptidylprolyl isomerase [unclassified Enterococcus]
MLITACDTGKEDADISSKASSSAITEKTPDSSSAPEIDLDSLELPQLSTEVAPNEDLVEMVTTMGSIKIKLFPELAPKTVENFMTHAKDGYYNGVIFHRVIDNFMIQGGDPLGNGTGGESIWGNSFADEFSPQLYNIRGALSMANAGPNTNGSQFFIVQNTDDFSANLVPTAYPSGIIDAYKNGGAPHLDGVHTVFGQVIEGMDVVDNIAKAEKNAADRPNEEIKIEEIKILQEAE